MTVNITAVILTKNEALVIDRAVRSVSFCNQVVVVDSNSTDDTVEIAANAGADVLNFTWDGKYPKKKQWSLEHPRVQYDWVLFIDADEYPTAELGTELCEIFKSGVPSDAAAYDARLLYTFNGSSLKHGYRVKKRALVNRQRCSFPVVDDLDIATMWEVEGHYQPRVNGEVRQLSGEIVHHDVDPLFDWFARHNRYSDWEAHMIVGRGAASVRSFRTKQGQLFDRVPFKPLVFFLYGYMWRGGFLDGRAGLDYALALSLYYWQIGLKVRELIREAEKTSSSHPGNQS